MGGARSWSATGLPENDIELAQKTVERYDPSVNEWNFVFEMNYARSWGSACVLNGRIFVAGGWGDDGKLVKNIECYDPTEDKWEIV